MHGMSVGNSPTGSCQQEEVLPTEISAATNFVCTHDRHTGTFLITPIL